ncbi:MAG: DUF1573 domain-containing protein [Deltaproteobacteria bacterium]|nr:DUF1573 domain-containing protein [Deltaproteobacteria bacterium]
MSRLVKMLLVLACLVPSLALAAPASQGPRVKFDKNERIYPEVKEGQKLTAEFPFTNTGEQNLIIDKVSPSCGCTVAEYDKVTEPGKQGKIKLILDTVGITGSFRKTAVVATNDPTNPFVTLVLTGETISRIKVDKGRRIDLIGCLGTDISTIATLTDPDGRGVIISGVENPMPQYLQTSLEPVPGGKAYKLHLKVKAATPLEFAGPVFLQVPGSPRVSLWVVVNVRGPFEVQPKQVFFGGVNKDKMFAAARSVLVKKACADKLEIDELAYDANKFKVERHWRKPGEELLLVVTPLADKLPKGPFNGELGIRQGDKMFRVILKGSVY